MAKSAVTEPEPEPDVEPVLEEELEEPLTDLTAEAPVVEDGDTPRVMTEAEMVVEAEAGRLFFCYEPQEDGSHALRTFDATEAGRIFLCSLNMGVRSESARAIALDVVEHGRKSEYAELVEL